MGPTASGKTDLAMALAERWPLSLISVDSGMVYRGMNIGTAKPDAATLLRAPHALIDICDPAEIYSAARFVEDARVAIQTAWQQGRWPCLVGGTMLYFRALLQGLSDLPDADVAIRAALQHELTTQGLEKLHQRLAQLDPVAAARIHPNDPQRILRALEVQKISGQTMTSLQQATPPHAWPAPILKLALVPDDRAQLHARIAQRFELMLQQGFIDEVIALRTRKDLYKTLPSIRAVGYRQVWNYLEGEYDRQTLQNKGIIATRQLAKRQLTWLRTEQALCIQDPLECNLHQQVERFAAMIDTFIAKNS